MILYAVALNDDLYGGRGDDSLEGGADHDRLYGGTGDDELHGDGGHDWLEGGEGIDNLYGGANADWFVFRTSNDGGIIHDYQAGTDKIEIIIDPGEFEYFSESDPKNHFDTLIKTIETLPEDHPSYSDNNKTYVRVHYATKQGDGETSEDDPNKNKHIDFYGVSSVEDLNPSDFVFKVSASDDDAIVRKSGETYYYEGTDQDDGFRASTARDAEDITNILDGGKGDDKMVNKGVGHNIYQFHTGDGHDTITDFGRNSTISFAYDPAITGIAASKSEAKEGEAWLVSINGSRWNWEIHYGDRGDYITLQRSTVDLGAVMELAPADEWPFEFFL